MEFVYFVCINALAGTYGDFVEQSDENASVELLRPPENLITIVHGIQTHSCNHA